MATTFETSATTIRILAPKELESCAARWNRDLNSPLPISYDPRWLQVLSNALGHEPLVLEATTNDRVTGILALAYVRSRIFGRFLVSLPYLNTAGVVASDDATARSLVDRAVQLADELRVRYLELRHEQPIDHPALNQQLTTKVHMRLHLPATAEKLLESFKSKLRSQIRKGEKNEFQIEFSRNELLTPFYEVFCRNMRDLGTPVYSRKLFAEIVERFPNAAEFCVVRLGSLPVAGALLIHGEGKSEVPSASSLRKYNSTNANMVMYWHMLKRSVERGQRIFDFGRSTRDSTTYRFKEQWGAAPQPAVWQYYVREGSVGDMRPENSRYQRLIQVWQRLPVWVTRVAGPLIVRGIP
jgi:serine/alanine adding enzyme